MKSYRKELFFHLPTRRGLVNITPQVEEALRDYDADKGGMPRLAEEIASEARRRQKGQREDDITVLVADLFRAD